MITVYCSKCEKVTGHVGVKCLSCEKRKQDEREAIESERWASLTLEQKVEDLNKRLNNLNSFR